MAELLQMFGFFHTNIVVMKKLKVIGDFVTIREHKIHAYRCGTRRWTIYSSCSLYGWIRGYMMETKIFQ